MSTLKNALKSAAIAIALPVMAGEAHATSVAKGANVVGSQKVTFISGDVRMAGNLYLPVEYDRSKKYPAIVVAHPWGGVKEQTSGLYAQQLAKKGFVTLAFDASHHGESGGKPRDLEDPAERVQDIRSAVGYLASLAEVDASRIGAMGVCAGGGYALNEAQTDLRVKAVAGVVAYDIGDATRNGIEGLPVSASDRQKLLEHVAAQLNKEAAGAPVLVQQLLPPREEVNAATPQFIREATEYYLTPRGAHPNARNRYVVTTPGLHIAYYPLEHMELISPRPVLLIAGENAETRKFSEAAFSKSLQPKELMIVPGASHFDLYDQPEYVNPAVEKLAEFFGKNL
ncbi:alpha/beta hydrolase [Pseudomonas sp. LFM046]|uniref:alpha/beta hydrolase n=1 Tax=Pseudomonas sp. LFM046 TaxID=1608357 RepID=UPI0005CFD560|nr:alpha/beta hydrolase [Pseudomonas sp. LFM046]